MYHKTGYKFTNKKHSVKGIMSTVLGLISMVSLFFVMYFTFQLKGKATFNYGIAGFFATLFAIAGLVLGVLSKMERDKFYLFSYIGIFFNVVVLGTVGFILYVGVYGL